MIETRTDSLEAWSYGLEKLSLPAIGIADLRDSKAERFDRLRALGLLRTPVISVNADLFLKSPQHYLAQVPGQLFTAFLEGISGSVREFSGRGVAREDLPEMVRRALGGRDATAYTLTFCRSFNIISNGNIFVRRDDSIFGEFTSGPRSPSQQRTAVACRFSRDPYLKVFHYSSEDPAMRRNIYRALTSLPGLGSGRNRTYLPGYYEVGIGQDDSSDQITPLFYDYRNTNLFIP